jgi:hypothetical protein
VVNIKDVTGSGFTEYNSFILLIVFAICLIIALLSIAATAGTDEAPIGVFVFVLSLIPLLAYFLSRRRLFVVNYAGGSVGTECRWYNLSEINHFQKQLYVLKDTINKNSL